MEFNPASQVIQGCLQATAMDENGRPEEALQRSLQAWSDAADDFEKFIAAYFVARHQKPISDKLKWFETALQLALKIDNDSTKSALPSLYSNIAGCYEALGDSAKSKENRELAASHRVAPLDQGPFFHGTKAALKVGDLLTAGGNSNYKADLKMNHIYFTALMNGAGLAAALAKGDGRERVYIVAPTGPFEDDPNVTDKKFPGNPTRSYRSSMPLKIVGEVTDWARQTPEQLQKWKQKLTGNKGEIIN